MQNLNYNYYGQIILIQVQAMKAMRSQPHRGVTLVASHYNGWYKETVEKRAFRYATASNPYRVPTARHLPQPCHQPLKWLAINV